MQSPVDDPFGRCCIDACCNSLVPTPPAGRQALGSAAAAQGTRWTGKRPADPEVLGVGAHPELLGVGAIGALRSCRHVLRFAACHLSPVVSGEPAVEGQRRCQVSLSRAVSIRSRHACFVLCMKQSVEHTWRPLAAGQRQRGGRRQARDAAACACIMDRQSDTRVT